MQEKSFWSQGLLWVWALLLPRLSHGRGAAVVLADINVDTAKRESDRLNAAGYRTVAIRCDVAEESQVASMIDETIQTFGKIDAAFNNAGIQIPLTGVADLTSIEYDRIMSINLRGVWLCMKYELLQMRKQGSGVIVNNSSIGGLSAFLAVRPIKPRNTALSG